MINPTLVDIPTEFNTRRLALGRYHSGDTAVYFRMLRQNLDHLNEFLPPKLVEVKNEQVVELIIHNFIAEWDLRYLFNLSAWECSTGIFVG